MDRNEPRPIASCRSAAFMLGALGFLVSAAPENARLVFDASAFAEENCLAPSFAAGGCFHGGSEPAGVLGPSASAALLEPHSWPERGPSPAAPRAMRLEPDLFGLFDFGPEVVHRLPPRRNRSSLPLRIAGGSKRMTACNAADRHRPDRSRCGGPASWKPVLSKREKGAQGKKGQKRGDSRAS
jgi:hypothetical protein